MTFVVSSAVKIMGGVVVGVAVLALLAMAWAAWISTGAAEGVGPRLRMMVQNRRTRRAVKDAIPRIVAMLESHGVKRVQWFLGFGGEPVIWLVTSTDAERDAVARQGFFREEVLAKLAEAGVGDPPLSKAGVTVESEESVERDWQGNWWYAMK